MRTRVVILVVDSFPHRYIEPATTPTLWKLATAFGHAPSHGLSVMTSSTRPNHATFTTGALPSVHGVVANSVYSPEGPLTAEPSVATIFDSMNAAGLRSTTILGDDNAIRASGSRRATHHWPSAPFGSSQPVDAFGHSEDATNTPRIIQTFDDETDLVIGRFTAVDTVSHLYGPDSDEAANARISTDYRVSELLDHFRSHATWSHTALFVLSDHDQETAVHDRFINLGKAVHQAGRQYEIYDEGAATYIHCATGPIDLAEIRAISGVAGAAFPTSSNNSAIAWAEPGYWFGAEIEDYLPGVHGSPRTRKQVAIAHGGHPAVEHVANEIAREAPSATFWAPMVADMLSVADPRTVAPPLPGLA